MINRFYSFLLLVFLLSGLNASKTIEYKKVNAKKGPPGGLDFLETDKKAVKDTPSNLDQGFVETGSKAKTGLPDRFFKFQNRYSGKCLDVSGVSNNAGANIHQWQCHNMNNQRFKVCSLNNYHLVTTYY
jgi:hypothetical protein